MRVMIVGLGDLGRELAHELLQAGQHELVLVDIDPARCERMSRTVDALVIDGDGTHPSVLEQAQVDRADAVVACTGSDALNMVVAMLSRRFGVPKVVVKLSDTSMRPACQQIGVTSIVNPSVAAAAQIRDVLSGGGDLDLTLVARGGMRLVEVDAKPVAKRRIDQLRFPDGTLVLAVLRRGDVLFPRRELALAKRDVLFCLVEDDAAARALRESLRSPE